MFGREDAARRLWAVRQSAGAYARALCKWVLLAGSTGLLCGALGAAFHHAVELVTGVREAHSWLLLLLPAAGLAVVFLYRKLKVEGVGTNDVIDEVHLGKGLPWTLLPAIFLSTVLTHLFGGSAGREGAALQMGGTVGYHVGRLFRLDDRDLRTATMTGMAAFFTALFGTPLAATVFAMMVISVGVFYHADFIPCLVASLVAFGVSILLGVAPTRFAIAAPDLTALMLLRVAGLAALCGLVASLFCHSVHFAERKMRSLLPNPWARGSRAARWSPPSLSGRRSGASWARCWGFRRGLPRRSALRRCSAGRRTARSRPSSSPLRCLGARGCSISPWPAG